MLICYSQQRWAPLRHPFHTQITAPQWLVRAQRFASPPNNHNYVIGFRVARSEASP